MLRDSSIMYELCTLLKDNRYINHDSDELLTKSQEQRINQYIDDLSIDLFFRLAPLKRIKITKDTVDYIGKHYTANGIEDINSDLELNLSNPLDRYTFLSIITHPNFLKNKFPHNRFVQNLMLGDRRYGATGVSFNINNGFVVHPYLDAFFEETRLINYDLCRAPMFYGLRDFMMSWEMEHKYDIYVYKGFMESMNDYPMIKDDFIFPDVTLEYALAIYIILVEKLNLKEDSIGSIFAFGLDEKPGNFTHPFQLFHNFELRLEKLFRKEEIVNEDIFLRFVNPETSKAFNVDFHNPRYGYVTIQLFKEKPITDVLIFNTLALPYLYHRLYNR